MAKYTSKEASSMESSGGSGFRLAKDGDRARVVFLYEGPESIDGWSCHRYTRPSGYTSVLDCPRSPKDPLDNCPACKAGDQLYTRIFVRMLNLTTNEVTVWDRGSSFRKDLVGFMEYFKPLYSQVYEITRRGSGLQTQYQYQSIGNSDIKPEQYAELAKQADEKAAEYVLPIEQYASVKTAWETAKSESAEEQVNVQNTNTGWGQPPQNQSWGQPPQNVPQNWGQAPQGNWGQPPQGGWGQNG